MRRTLALSLILCAPAAAATMPSPNWPGPADRSEAMLQSVVLGAHNRARAEFGVAPVRWNASLAEGALAHARYMAATGVYGHDRTPGRRQKSGENLWRGPKGVFAYDVMIGVMVDEKRHFRPGAFPANASNGDWHSVAHFTQIVWPTTTEIGCALASSATTDYFVCRYAPTGNKDGTVLSARAADPLAPLGGTQLAERGD